MLHHINYAVNIFNTMLYADTDTIQIIMEHIGFIHDGYHVCTLALQ